MHPLTPFPVFDGLKHSGDVPLTSAQSLQLGWRDVQNLQVTPVLASVATDLAATGFIPSKVAGVIVTQLLLLQQTVAWLERIGSHD